MGNSLSLSRSKTLSPDDLILQSRDAQAMSKALFEFMYSTWKPRDAWDIAENPDKYVIAISDLITTQFHVLGYKKKSGMIGEIYFQEYDTLEPPAPSDKIAERNTRNRRNLNRLNNSRKKNLEKILAGKSTDRKLKSDTGFPIHKQNAQIIAFFFVRMFQILGALLLVIKDINLPDYDERTGDERTLKKNVSGRPFAQQMYPPQQTISGFKPSGIELSGEQREKYRLARLKDISTDSTNTGELPPLTRLPPLGSGVKVGINRSQMTGGGSFKTEIPLGPYEFLRYYLRPYTVRDIEYFKANGITTDFKPDTHFMFEGSQVLVFKYIVPTDKTEIDNSVVIELGIPGKDMGTTSSKLYYLKVTIDNIKFVIRGSDNTVSDPNTFPEYIPPSKRATDKLKSESYPSSVTIRFPKMINQITGKNTVTFSNSNIIKEGLSDGIPYYISSAENGRLDEAKTSGLNPSKDIVKIIENITKYYLVKCMINVSGIQMKSYEQKSSTNSNNSIKSKLKAPSNKTLEPIFKILNSDKNRPHCISRALKLLDMGSITGKFPSRVGASKVCSPDTDRNLSSYASTKSVGQLYGKIDPTDYKKSMDILKAFVGKEATGEPLGIDYMNDPTERNELQAAIKRLSEAFKMTYDEKAPLKNFSQIEVKPLGACGTSTADIPIDNNSNEARNLRESARALLGYHFKQVMVITEFLSKIFNVKPGSNGAWTVEGPNTSIMFGGYDALHKVTTTARNLLVEYYAGCESIYQEGTKVIEEKLKTASDAAATTTRPAGVVLPSARAPVAPAAVADPAPLAAPVAPPASAPPMYRPGS